MVWVTVPLAMGHNIGTVAGDRACRIENDSREFCFIDACTSFKAGIGGLHPATTFPKLPGISSFVPTTYLPAQEAIESSPRKPSVPFTVI